MAKSKIHWHYGCGRGHAFNPSISAETFESHSSDNPDWFCVTCATKARLALAAESAPKPDPRSDSERYAELRKLVEAWQSAYHQNDKAQTKDHPITEGWLKHWLHFCDTQKPLLDWSHR